MRRHYTLGDRLLLQVDQVLRALTNNPDASGRANPATKRDDISLTDSDRKESAALMRINHTGEICAQALYHGQALVAKDKAVQKQMQHAALEEGDHLNWCHQRLVELGSHTSYLNPFWYAGSFCIGMIAGIMSDKISFGFVAETEKQVVQHLEKHQQILPAADFKSREILQQMGTDEEIHRQTAIANGGETLPPLIQAAMKMTSKIMVKTAYYI